jgi:hypothetical protein
VEARLIDTGEILKTLGPEEKTPSYWIGKAVEILSGAYPPPKPTNWHAYEKLNSHACVVIQHARKYQILSQEFLSLQNSDGSYLLYSGRYDSALECFTKAIEMGRRQKTTAGWRVQSTDWV